MEQDREPEPREKNPASRAEWVLSFIALSLLILGATGIAGAASIAVFAVGMLIGIVVLHMTCARLHLRIPVEFGFVIIIPMMAVLAVVLFPLFSSVREHDRQSSCAASMRMIGVAIESYCADWDGKLPPGDRWNELILEREMDNFRDFCPKAPGALPSYALNGRLEGKRLKDLPKDTVMLFECTPGRNQAGGPELLPPDDMHPKGINVLFADGSVKAVHHSQVSKLRWRP